MFISMFNFLPLSAFTFCAFSVSTMRFGSLCVWGEFSASHPRHLLFCSFPIKPSFCGERGSRRVSCLHNVNPLSLATLREVALDTEHHSGVNKTRHWINAEAASMLQWGVPVINTTARIHVGEAFSASAMHFGSQCMRCELNRSLPLKKSNPVLRSLPA